MVRFRAAWRVITAAGLGLCLGLVVVTIAPSAKAESQMASAQPALAKGDRLVPAKGAACSAFGWPHYERRCLFDRTRPYQEPGSVRIIATR
jgi:hypothetical protein